MTKYPTPDEGVPVTIDPVPGTLEDVRDRLVRADKSLRQEAAVHPEPYGGRATHLASKAEGVRLALSYVEDALRMRPSRVLVDDSVPPADPLSHLRLVPVEEGEEIAAARREGAVQALREAAEHFRQGAGSPIAGPSGVAVSMAIAATIDGRADAIEAGEDPS